MESTGTTQPTNLINHIVVRVSGKDRGLHPSPPSGVWALAFSPLPQTSYLEQQGPLKKIVDGAVPFGKSFVPLVLPKMK
jgi:hypothetical protein